MKPTVELRDAALADLPALLALEALFPGDRLAPRQMRRHLIAHRHPFRVAADAEGLLGYSLVFQRAGSDRARLYSIVVAPRARGQGLGRRLLDDAQDQARARGCRRIGLEVRADNAPAIALYRAAGYRELAPRPGYYEDGMSALRFERRLDGPA